MLSVGGCCGEHDSARCGAPPEEDITSFTVTTRTGEDGSDADICFCIDRASSGVECMRMDDSGDDFEDGARNAFNLTPSSPVVPGDLDGFFIDNLGNGAFGNNEWEIVALKVEVMLANDTFQLLYNEPTIDCENDIDAGQRYRPKHCEF